MTTRPDPIERGSSRGNAMGREEDAPAAKRLEQLWSGEFGDAYLERNRSAGEKRGPFWQKVLSQFQSQRVLEVGCNIGGNLSWIASYVSPEQIFGIDINPRTLEELSRRLPRVNAVRSAARELPFRDGVFDLVFTVGVLIHQPPDFLPQVMAEIIRCSRRFILCAEYFANQPATVHYRGQTDALFKRDFGGLYLELFPRLTVREQGYLTPAQGWDDVTYWILEKSPPGGGA